MVERVAIQARAVHDEEEAAEAAALGLALPAGAAAGAASGAGPAKGNAKGSKCGCGGAACGGTNACGGTGACRGSGKQGPAEHVAALKAAGPAADQALELSEEDFWFATQASYTSCPPALRAHTHSLPNR